MIYREEERKSRKDKKRKNAGASEERPGRKGHSDEDMFKEALEKELGERRKPAKLNKNKTQSKASHHGFKSMKRMKRR